MILERFAARWLRLAVWSSIGALAASGLAAQTPAQTLFAWEEALTGDEERKLRWPTAVAAGGVDEIAVTDAAGPALWIFRDRGGAEGWVLQTTVELPAPAFSMACGIERFLVSTRQPGRLVTISKPDYRVREILLPAEIIPGTISCAADNRLLLHDLAGGRLLLLGEGFEILTSVPVDGAVSGLSPGSAGDFYAAFPATGEVRRYGANGDLLGTLAVPGLAPTPAWPVGLLVAANGEVTVADRHGGRILVLTAGGRWVGTGSRRGWEPGLLRFPRDIARLPDGRIVVADQGNGRVQVFRRLEEREQP